MEKIHQPFLIHPVNGLIITDMCKKIPLNVFVFRNAQTLKNRRVKYSGIGVYLFEFGGMLMKSKPIFFIVLAVLLVSLSCMSTTQVSNDSGQTQVPQLSSPFAAEATSPMSVQLAWQPVTGVQKYLLAVRLGDSEFIPIAELPADQTSFEDFPVPDSSELTYRLQAVTSSATSDVGTATVTTSEVEPNPLTVQANDYAPIVWAPPTPDPNDPNIDPSIYFPPGFDPDNPEDFDPASAMQQVETSGEIGPEGGTLSITTPDNITYELIIPPDALEESTLISLIPIETIDGLPFDGGLQGAVRIEPDGLMLDLPATLRITRADAAPVPDGMVTLAFGFDGSGQEFHLLPFAPSDQVGFYPGTGHVASLAAAPLRAGPLAEIALQQLKDYGYVNATPKKAAAVVKSHTPTGAEERMLNELAYGEADPELAPLGSRQGMATAKLLSLAQSDALGWRQMTISLAQLEILMNYYGKDPKLTGDLTKIMDLLIDRLTKMLQVIPEKCLSGNDPYAQAVAGKILGARPGSMYAALKKKLDPKLLKDVTEKYNKCKLYLTIDSRITEDDKKTVKNDVMVAGEIGPLKFNFKNGKVFLTGRGNLAKFYQGMIISPYPKPKDVCAPWTPDNLASVTPQVIVTRIDLVIADVDNGVLQEVKLSPMSISDNTVFKGKMNCKHTQDDGKIVDVVIPGKIPAEKGSLWHGFFIVAHMAEPEYEFEVLSPDGNDEIVASYNSERPSFSPGYGTWSEYSTFDLINKTPKK